MERSPRKPGSWTVPWNHYILILPPYLFVVLLTAFIWMPSKKSTTSWVCASCARVLTEHREVKLGIPIDGWRKIEDGYLCVNLNPLNDCSHAWWTYGGAGEARLAALKTAQVEAFLGSIALLGSSSDDLVRWDLRGTAAGTWTRGPFPILKSEQEFRDWFRALQAADPERR